ncbi:MAG TPA: MdtA/MuxA family multidrug efflux RND transporter periplasmic adaptor subunit [Burkholderiales bacterium]|nr:MdtA/MuxA family multidrug efflux RND transporter periplasmic adaptor subunit [Burkholderiales bacterium]
MSNAPLPPLADDNLIPPAMQRDSRPRAWWSRWWLWLIVLCLLGGGAWLVFAKPEAGGKPAAGGPERAGKGGGMNRPPPVVAAAAKSGDINLYLNGLGTVVPLNTVTVHSRVDGALDKIMFREGQVVKEGDLLAQIDPRPFQVQLAQAEGQMARDQALLQNAKADLERYRTLFEQDSIAKQQLDTQASLVGQYQSALKVDQAAIDNARLQLTYSRITAPISGRLGLRQVDVGNIVHAGDTTGIVVITQLQPITVVFTLPEDNISAVMKKVHAGQKLSVDAYDRAGKVKLATGTLLTIDNQIDTTTGTIKLKAQFDNEDAGLFPNQFVNARMLLDVKHDAVLIPSAAVLRGTQGTFVYVVKEDKTVTVRPVKVGTTEGETSAIDSGVAVGESVVIDGTDKLREGARVEISTRDASAPAADAADGGQAKRGKRHRDGNAPASESSS